MDVCILSMQRVDNMGSVLQSYALKNILESLGCRVDFLDIKRIDADYILLKLNDIEKTENRSTIKNKLKKIDGYLINRLKNKVFLRKQVKEYEFFRDNKLELNKTDNKYDLCVIGSDEVFNCLDSSYWGFTSQLFGNVPEAKHVITYAASCGATTYKAVPEKIVERIKVSISNIEGFSVRDENTKNFITEMTDRKVILNLDPVIVYDFKKEVEAARLVTDLKDYCIIYSYYNRIQSDDEINAIKEFCQKKGLTPLAVGSPQFWVNHYCPCSPFECLKLFEKAAFVITDTFHGTIFSAKYAKRYAVMIRDSNRNKLGDLIERLGIQSHLIEIPSDIQIAYDAKKEDISSILLEERKKTDAYLRKFCRNE